MSDNQFVAILLEFWHAFGIIHCKYYNNKYLKEWQKINWLKGKLGIIFDENNEFKINNITLIYDDFYGLYYRKIEGDDDDKI